MKKRWLLALLAGLGGGFGAARVAGRAPPEETPGPAALELPHGPSGPGITCPAPAPELASACDADGSASAAFTGEGAVCSSAPRGDGHLIFDPNGEAVPPPFNDPFWFAYYRGQRPMEIGDGSVINGGVVRMAQLVTHDDANAVLKSFRRQFELNQIRPFGSLLGGPRSPYTMSFPSSDRLTRTVTLAPIDSGTLIVASVGKPNPDKAHELPDDFPVPGDASEVSVDTIRDGPSTQRDLSFVVSSKFDDVRDFYLKKLPGIGFNVEPVPWHREDGKSWTQNFRRNAESLSLRLDSRNEKAVQVTAMWITAQDSKEGSP
ncbi:MAG: hypothetical protein JST54_17140 [Deltaproteobacteria bacterium]|nr:hypothetical protein [Deltaproteobacteria bacterium]